MFVDFVCNDIGCVCQFGFVIVFEMMVIECYLYVMYIVLQVEGKIFVDKNVYDFMCVIFFVGIVSGVLKICVMQIIVENEFL